jgi:glycosyltransferase 2 family protein
MNNVLKYSLSLLLAAGLIWWNFRDANFAQLWSDLSKADVKWIFVSAALTFVAHGSRAIRWRMLLEPLGHRPSVYHTNLAVWFGYFANFLVPRAGEVSRCATLQRTDGVPFEKSFGTVVAERVFDVLSLLVLIGLNFLLEFDRLSGFFIDFFKNKLGGSSSENGVSELQIALGLIFLGSAVLVGLFAFNRSFRERLLQNALIAKIWGFVQGLLAGVLSIKQLKSPGWFLFHTLLIWSMYYLMSYTLFFALPQSENLGPLAGLTILVMGAIGMATPTPGGIGPFHILVGNVAVLYGLTAPDGQLLATFIQGSQMLTVLLVGGVAFLLTLAVRRAPSVGHKDS